MPQYGWHVDINKCIACRACEAACKQEYQLAKGVRRRLVIVQEGTAPSGRPYRRHITAACNHCASPACAVACPVKRYWKDDTANATLRAAFGMTANPPTGLVMIKPSKAEDPTNGVDCIGCKRCLAACPYGAPSFDASTNTMDKCTGCYHRLFAPGSNGLPAGHNQPACVVTCTSMALHFDDMANITPGVTYGVANATTGAPAGAKEIAPPTLTTPSVRFAPQTNIT